MFGTPKRSVSLRISNIRDRFSYCSHIIVVVIHTWVAAIGASTIGWWWQWVFWDWHAKAKRRSQDEDKNRGGKFHLDNGWSLLCLPVKLALEWMDFRHLRLRLYRLNEIIIIIRLPEESMLVRYPSHCNICKIRKSTMSVAYLSFTDFHDILPVNLNTRLWKQEIPPKI